MSTRPIVLLTFAKNDLNSVSQEAKQIHALVSAQPLVEAVCVEDANKEKLGKSVADIGKRLRMYHFSGHANEYELVLDNFMKLDKIRFSRLLKSGGGSLDFVFLNGCHSYGHVAHLTANGVKAVIVTSTSINDRIATQLSIVFYELFFTQNYTLNEAFFAAEARVATGYIPYLHITYPGEIDANDSLKATWTLIIHKEYKEVMDWTLADFVNPPKKRKIPWLLTDEPSNPPYFLGRESDLDAIQRAFAVKNQPLFLVNGEGGIGKTTLAERYWHQQEASEGIYAHLGWVNASNGILNGLLPLRWILGVELEPRDTPNLQFQKILAKLRDLDKFVLLVLDNANDAPDLKACFMELQKLKHCHILVTTRVQEWTDARLHRVEPLNPTEALKLFAHYYKPLMGNELTLLKSLFEAVGYNTLVIELLAKNLNALNDDDPDTYPMAQLLADLQTNGLLAIENQAVDVRYQSPVFRTEKPEAILRAMYDLRPLSVESVSLLSNFSVLPPQALPFKTLRDLLQPKDETIFKATLKDLRQKGWIRKAEEAYRVSPVVQAVVRDKNAAQLRSDCDGLIQKLIRKLNSDTLHEENYKYSTVFAGYAESVVNCFSEPNPDIALLTQGIGTFHGATGNLDQAMIFYLKMNQILQSLCTTNPKNTHFKNGLAISYSRLGFTHAELGHLETALKFYDAYFKLSEELYAVDPSNVSFKNGLAFSYERLGFAHASLGRLEAALNFYKEQHKLSEELYALYPLNVDFKNRLALSYERLGSTHASLGQLETALKFYEKRHQLGEELYALYPSNVGFKNGLAIAYSKLGETHASLGQFEAALKFYEKRHQLGEELYAFYPSNVGFKDGLAIAYSKLGEIHAQLGHLETALKFYEKRHQLSKELYALYPSNIDFKKGLATSHDKLGETHASLGQLETALKFYEEYFKLMGELYTLDSSNVYFKNGLAISYGKLGKTHAELGHLETALTLYEEWHKLGKELYARDPSNVSFKNGLAISYSKLGETHALLGQLETTLTFYESYFKLSKELYETASPDVTFVFHYALSSSLLGGVKLHLEGTKASLPYIENAYQIFLKLYETTQTPLYYQHLKRTEILLQSTKPGCRAFLMRPLIWFFKLPFMREKAKKMAEHYNKELREDYQNLQK
jgi:tetratricopeptide (TPR) repeat protein